MKRLAVLFVFLTGTAYADSEGKPMSKEEAQAKIMKTLNASGSAVDACTSRYLLENAKKSGHAQVKVTVAEDGTVATAEVTTSLQGARNLRSCLEKVTKRWRFPKPGGPGQSFSLKIPVKPDVKFRMLSEAEKKSMSESDKKKRDGFLTLMPNFTFRGPSK